MKNVTSPCGRFQYVEDTDNSAYVVQDGIVARTGPKDWAYSFYQGLVANPKTPDAVLNEVRTIYQRGHIGKISTIRLIRAAQPMGLKEAKNVMESWTI